MKGRVATAALALFCCGCVSLNRIDSALGAVRDGDLVRALVELDAVPPGDPRYPEARATADAVERRVRVAHRLMQQAFDLRAQRRDQAAAASIATAKAIWPDLPGIEALGSATAARIDSLRKESGSTNSLGEVMGTSTMVDSSALPAPGAVASIVPSEDPTGPVDPADWPGVESEARRLLGQGRVDRAILLLEGMRSSGHVEESNRLWLSAVRSRARTAYARGDLRAAGHAWQRVLDAQAQDVEALGYLAAIRAEQDWRATRVEASADAANPDG